MSTYESPMKARPSFYSQHEPRMNSHVYRSGKKDIRHMTTDPDLLSHCAHTPSSPASDSQSGPVARFENAAKARYGSALKPRYMQASYGDRT